jgi:hypothetical protein
MGKCCFYSARGGGGHDFQSADKDTHDLSWCCEKANSPHANKPGSHDLISSSIRHFLIAGFIAETFLRVRRREVRRLSGG